MNSIDEKTFIEEVRRHIESAKGSRIWDDYINALNLISQVVFAKSSGFILELLQNAEDAGQGKTEAGYYKICINEKRIKIVHNGNLFTRENVQAICGIRSSKKPENGTLGYLGIGFKSVFKIADSAEVYSGEFRFKFDRNHKEWDNPNSVPWHVIPLWIDEPSENGIDVTTTTFILPFREVKDYANVAQEVRQIRTDLYLFLKWIKNIEIVDETIHKTWAIKNLGENDKNITTLMHDQTVHKFVMFRKTVNVPAYVAEDRLTQQYRRNVKTREIVIAFAIDKYNNLVPWIGGAMSGGVYSFLPLNEEKSGMRFIMQADFLVQPGREAIHYEAIWNHWLIEEIAELCIEKIEFFKTDGTWKYQFLEVFDFFKSEKNESYQKLFGPKLIAPLEKYLEVTPSMVTMGGDWITADKAVEFGEEFYIYKSLITDGILADHEIGFALTGKPDFVVIHQNVKTAYFNKGGKPEKKENRWGFLKNEGFLNQKAKEATAGEWFRKLYIWLNNHPFSEKDVLDGRRKVIKRYHHDKIVLTAKNETSIGGEVSMLDLPSPDPLLRELGKALEIEKKILHPDIISPNNNNQENETLKGFLRGYTGLQTLDTEKVCKISILPKILSSAPKPSEDDLINWTVYCKQILGSSIEKGDDIWVLAKGGEIRSAKETVLPSIYLPKQNWEKYSYALPEIKFVNDAYMPKNATPEEIESWRTFFNNLGVKEAPDSGVEILAEYLVFDELNKQYKNVTKVAKMNFGYDMEAQDNNGKTIRVEVKGQSQDHDVELTPGETDSADKYSDGYHVYIVTSVPEKPTIYRVINPAAPGIGKKEKLSIPIEMWKSKKYLMPH